MKNTRDILLDDVKDQMQAFAASAENGLNSNEVAEMTRATIGEWLASNSSTLTGALGGAKWREINLCLRDELLKAMRAQSSIGMSGIDVYRTFPDVQASKSLRAALKIPSATWIMINDLVR